MALAVEHLIKSGRRVIGYMGGPEGVYTAQDRLRGFIQAMKGANCPVNPNLIILYATNLEEGYHTVAEMLWPEGDDPSAWNAARAYLGRRGAHPLLTQHPEVNGVICFDDQLAFGALRAGAELERRVPEDVAIIGCNDIPLASQVTPTLTTQRIPAFETVPGALEEAARIDGANDWQVPWHIIIPTSLPAMAVITLFYPVGQWNAWFGAMLYLRNRELYPLQLILREILISNSTATMTSGASAGDVMPLGERIKYATMVVATLPGLCIYPFLQRYFVKGVMIGAIRE